MICRNCNGRGCGECYERAHAEIARERAAIAERRKVSPVLPSPVTRADFLRGAR